MATHLVFLRSVNVGKRAYPMAELRAVVEGAGYADVATHIQTGNLRLGSQRSAAELTAALEPLLEADRGFEVPVVVMSPEQLVAVVEDASALAEDAVTRQYVELLRAAPETEDVPVIEAQSRAGQRFVVRGRAVHLLLEDVSFHEVKAAPAAVRRAMGVSTNRNRTVLEAIAAKWC
ncbi:DUF1697 domain-containing protein [Marmoricola endophyticus]|uniref:DUF1697 domain-containing protein n=1 Tax=Marmoricola endophyticus TaxID=2040280 RepID=UPI00166ED301|nr:DUF1697 domain-containing protein [Marmoricola endophyticus]